MIIYVEGHTYSGKTTLIKACQEQPGIKGILNDAVSRSRRTDATLFMENDEKKSALAHIYSHEKIDC